MCKVVRNCSATLPINSMVAIMIEDNYVSSDNETISHNDNQHESL